VHLTNRGAKGYFDRIPVQWDALYSRENHLTYAFNRVFRKGLFERYDLTWQKCGNLEGASVLDIGCGTGRYSIEFAKRGAARVVGIDFAPAMVSFCENMAQEMDVADRCEFICDDFSTATFGGPFDVVAALGLFDYVPDPETLFRRISGLTRKTFVGSFPKRQWLWSVQRKIRYQWIKKCPIYYYDFDQLTKLVSEAGFPDFEIINMQSGFFVCGRK
jgi:2-polyprenyl-3-methyl-5-hydroxy-6-metoxy-1,4-benzoquinol methylase